MFQPKTNSKSFIAIDRQTLQLLLYTVRDKILGLNFKISIFEMESIFCTATQYDWLLAWYYCLSVWTAERCWQGKSKTKKDLHRQFFLLF